MKDTIKITDEEIAEFGKEVIFFQEVELTTQEEIEEAKLLSQVVDNEEYKALD